MSMCDRVRNPCWALLGAMLAACSTSSSSTRLSAGGDGGGSGLPSDASTTGMPDAGGEGSAPIDGAPMHETGTSDAPASPDSGTKSTVPVCGANQTQAPILPGMTPSGGGTQNWATFAAPTILGGHYTDALGGCEVTKVTQLGSSSVGIVYDSEVGVFSQDDKMLWVQDPEGGAEMIVSTPADGAHTPGSAVVTASQMPSKNDNVLLWSYAAANQFYYTNRSDIMLAAIEGLPGCIATASCSVTSTTVASFASTGGSTGAGYTSIIFPDKYDAFPDKLAFLGRNADGTMDLDVWDLASSTNVNWYTTTCTTTDPLGTQPGCIHGILQFPDGTVMIGYGASDGDLSGNVWFHGTPGNSTVTKTTLSKSSCHNAVGYDLAGTEKWIACREADPGSVEACPNGQFAGQTSGGGQDLISLEDPFNSMGSAICSLNINWEAQEFSYHGNTGSKGQPYYLTSFWDANRVKSAERFATDADYLANMAACTQTDTTVSGGCWVPYQDELVLVRIDNDFNAVCTSPSCFRTVYRMGIARARSLSGDGYYGIPNASLSRDGNYIAFNSNMAYPSGASGPCSASNAAVSACSETYVLSAPSGAPIFGP
jgi:hypothetical protein